MKLFALLVVPALLLPFIAGCQSTEHSTSVEHTWDGGTKVKQTTVTDHGGGDVSTDQKTTTVSP